MKLKLLYFEFILTVFSFKFRYATGLSTPDGESCLKSSAEKAMILIVTQSHAVAKSYLPPMGLQGLKSHPHPTFKAPLSRFTKVNLSMIEKVSPCIELRILPKKITWAMKVMRIRRKCVPRNKEHLQCLGTCKYLKFEKF